MTKYYKLNYAVVKIYDDPFVLLKGLTSNDLDANKNAFLDRFGKIVIAFYQVKYLDHVLIIFNSKYYDKLIEHLDKFLKLTRVKLERIDYEVYYELDKECPCNDNEIVLKQEKGNIIVTKNQYESISDDEFNEFRLKNNIPLFGVDFTNEMILNVSEDYVSYEKGCYLGQEVVARVHYKSKPPKKLVVKEIDGKNEFIFVKT
jgi:tRNA-modifying protein YgfZ